jgi:stearoyl-CoA desaturase (delta-9 desaturase)
MAPNSEIESAKVEEIKKEKNGLVEEDDIGPNDEEPEYKMKLKWRNIIAFIYLHIFSIVSFFYLPHCLSTYIYQFFLAVFIGFGTTAGSHRLFTHRTYRAKPLLRWFIIYLQTMAGQEPIYRWVRDHRVHHKFTDTNADPHNSQRGFFFSHMGWLCCQKHPDVSKYGKRIDMSDLEDDKVIQFQRKIYTPATFICSMVLPTLITMAMGEHWWPALNFNVFRYTIGLHFVWLVNSGAHAWGTRPYQKDITATDSYIVATLALGEGWHNYHHVFPWDYKTAESAKYWLNPTTLFIDVAAKLGLATDLKTVPQDIIKARVLRTGDGTHKYSKMAKEDVEANGLDNNNYDPSKDSTIAFWGWDDADMTEKDVNSIVILNREVD